MNIDMQGTCFSPFKAQDSNPGLLKISPGGVGRNIAENLVLLGVEVELVSILGDDEAASMLEESCAALGIGLDGTVRLENSPSCQYLCLLDCDGSLAGAVAAMQAMEKLGPDRLAENASLFDEAAIIIIDANIPESSIRWLADRYPRGGKRPLIGFDPVSAAKAHRGASSLGAFDFAKPNQTEAAILAGTELGPPGELARTLRAKGLGEAFISLGGEGLLAEGVGQSGGTETWISRLPQLPVPGLHRLSASGAGDAACAAIAWGLLGGLDLPSRCALALAASIIAGASESPVNPLLSAALLQQTAKGIQRERVS